MKDPERKKTSKFLSYVLRHHPEVIGLQLDANGWANTEELLLKANQHHHAVTFEELTLIVENNDKKRFLFSDSNKRIRANQGHSVQVDLQLTPGIPPDELYHGTALQNLDSIQKQGLIKGSRHQVHLSADKETAKMVSMRYGKPVVLLIHAKQMHADGQAFYLSENGVWLTDSVSPYYIKFPS